MSRCIIGAKYVTEGDMGGGGNGRFQILRVLMQVKLANTCKTSTKKRRF